MSNMTDDTAHKGCPISSQLRFSPKSQNGSVFTLAQPFHFPGVFFFSNTSLKFPPTHPHNTPRTLHFSFRTARHGHF